MNLQNENNLKDIRIVYGDTSINIIADAMDITTYKTFISQIPYYLDILDQAIATLGTPLTEPVNILPLQRRLSIGNSKIYSVPVP